MRFPNEMVGADGPDPESPDDGAPERRPGSRPAGPAGRGVRRRVELAAAGDVPPSDLLLTVVHQLRSPLAAILGAASVLDDVVPDQQTHFLDIIERNVRRALRLVDDLAGGSGVASGPVGAERAARSHAAVDLRRVVGDAVNDALQAGLLEHHRIRGIGIAEPAVVHGDRDGLSQVFDNLLRNAVAYTPRGGTLTIAVEVRGPVVRAWVRDTGHGIPAEEHGRVFERYFRGTDAVERGVPGSGIGLAVVRDVAEAHGGKVGIDSASGDGTTVWVELPLAPTEEAPSAPA